MANEFVTLGGYGVKDPVARAAVEELKDKTASDLETLQRNISTSIGALENDVDTKIQNLNDSTAATLANMQNSIDTEIENLHNETAEIEEEFTHAKHIGNDYYALLFTPYCGIAGYYPQGTCFLDDDTVVCAYVQTSDNTAIYQKVKVSTGEILKESSPILGYHANSLTFDGANTIYSVQFYQTGTTGISNVIQKIDANSLSLIGTITITALSVIGIRSATYKNGYLYVMDRNWGFWKYNIATGEIEKLFDFTQKAQQVAFIDSKDRVWMCGGGGGNLYVYDLQGNLIHTVALAPYSSDYAGVMTEYESINELSDGTIVISDIGWKYTVNGRYNRHIFYTLGVNKSPHHNNSQMRLDSTQTAINCSNTYKPIQYGTPDFPYDSIDYAGKIATILNSHSVLALVGETYNQYAILSGATISIYNGTISGLVLDRDANVELVNTTVTGAAGEIIKTEYNLPRPTAVLLLKFATFSAMPPSIIDGLSMANMVGVTIGYGSEQRVAGGVITNCATPIYTSAGGNQLLLWGGYVPDTQGAGLVPLYRVAQTNNIKYRMVGGPYGMQTVNVNKKLSEVTTVEFNAANFNNDCLFTLGLNWQTYTFDLTAHTGFTIVHHWSNKIYVIYGTATPSVTNGVATVTFGSLTAYELTATGPVPVDLSLFTVTKLRVF